MKKKTTIVVILVCMLMMLSAVLISSSKSNNKSTDSSFSAGNTSGGETIDKASSGEAMEAENQVDGITGGAYNGNDEALSTVPTPVITDPEELLQAELTQSAEASGIPVPTKTAEEKVTPSSTEAGAEKKNTPTPAQITKPTQEAAVTKAAVKTPTPVPSKAPTAVPTKVPEKVCNHDNWGVISITTVYPEEGHWETQDAWDEPVWSETYVCCCGKNEVEYREDKYVSTTESKAAFLNHTGLEMHSYGVTSIIIDTIHHEATQVWVVDKLEQTSYKEIGWECYDCGYKEYW